MDIATFRLEDEAAAGSCAEACAVADEIVAGAIAMLRPAEFALLRVTTFFDRKWRKFRGKPFSAFGVADPRVPMPAFHPRDVLAARHAVFDGDAYVLDESAPPLHTAEAADAGQTRPVPVFVDAALFAWFGVDSASERASLMVYLGREQRWESWHVELQGAAAPWRVHKVKGTSARDVERVRGFAKES